MSALSQGPDGEDARSERELCPMIKTLQNIYFPVEDVDAFASFLEQALGLGLKFRDGDRWVQFDCGNSSLSVSAPSEAPVGVSAPVPVLEVDDIAAARIRIVDMGGTVLDERDMGDHGQTLAFAAPNGQVLQLLQRA
jgi:predicted enzyme related to lactoylglutathione lyase